MLNELQKDILTMYEVYEDGRVYSFHTNKFLKPDIVNGYEQFTLNKNGNKFRIKGHQLVALKYLKKPNGKNHINHKDGDKRNNHFNNLEWCTPYENNKHARDFGLNDISKSNSTRWECEEFRRKTSKNISDGLIKNGSNKGEKNPKFRYRILYNGLPISRQELSKITGYALSTTDVKMRESSQGKEIPIFKANNIEIIDTKKDVQTNERVG